MKNIRFSTLLILLVLSFLVLGSSTAFAGPVFGASQLRSERKAGDSNPERIVFPTGVSARTDSSHVSVPGTLHRDIAQLLECLKQFKKLNYVNLGTEADEGGLTAEDIAMLTETFPQVRFDYSFNVFGVEVPLDAEELDFNHVPMDDNGAKVVSMLSVLRNPKSLDMDFTGVDNSVMESLRETYPDMDIQWRIWIGDYYSIRTDAERFVASEPTVEVLTGNALEPLKYCTKIRFLDIGHNEISDISFLRNMPELESAVICLNSWTDLSPISNCTKLNYLEINDTNCTDLTPLASLTSLEHLNVCNLQNVTGWEALHGLKKLERLWIGIHTAISKEELQALREALPDTTIDTTSGSSDLGSWRWTHYPERVPRYEQLFMEMGYYMSPSNQSYYYHDDSYYPEGYSGPTTKFPEFSSPS